MKEQQRPGQTARSGQARQEEARRERRASGQTRTAELPARQWARLVQSAGGDLLELSVPQLEQLAKGVGNSSLSDLLGRGGGGGPTLYRLDNLARDGPEPEDNPIVTSPPVLLPMEGWPAPDGPRLTPSRPSALRAGG